MACTSLTALPLACGGGLKKSGLHKLYAVSYNDLQNIAGTDSVYAESTNGLINNINLLTGKFYTEIGLIQNTSGLATAGTFDRATGTGSITQTFTLQLTDMSEENRIWIETVFGQPIALAMKLYNSKYFSIGENGQLYLDSLQGGTGTGAADLQGYTLTFSTMTDKLTRQIDPTIIPDLLNL